jgi:hypothetical protein
VVDALDDGHDRLPVLGSREAHQKVLASDRFDQLTKRPFVVDDVVRVADQTRVDVASNPDVSVPRRQPLHVLVQNLTMRNR